jgi:hypothetical protein
MKVIVLIEGAVTLKNDDLKKVVSKKEDTILTNEETKIYADDLNKLQRAGFIKLELSQKVEEPVEEVQLTPEQIAEKKASIKAKIAELEKEMPNANAARQVEIKNEAKALKKEYKAL